MDFNVKQAKFDKLMDDKEYLVKRKKRNKQKSIKNIILSFTLLPLYFGAIYWISLSESVMLFKILLTIIPSTALFITSAYCLDVGAKLSNVATKTQKMIEFKDREIEQLVCEPVTFKFDESKQKMEITSTKNKIIELKEFKNKILKENNEPYKKPYIKK